MQKEPELRLKCPEVQKLGNYEGPPPKSFWNTFPFSSLPTDVSSNINVKTLDEIIKSNEEKLTFTELSRAFKCVDNFKFGASSFQKMPLPSCFCKNSVETAKFGTQITDTIATWVKKGFVAGPFDMPPFENFRVNPLIAVDQGEKIRPVLNASLPKDMSFNDNVDVLKTEKVYMSTARRFGFAVCDAGINSIMSKFDLIDAYKNIPAKIFDLRLQGFSWLSKYFVECTQIFGAKTAVANFDIFGNTVLALTLINCDIPRMWVHRALDDVPVVAPAKTMWCEEFSTEYVKTCEKIGVKLAENCSKNEKAFTNVEVGKVLGIYFDSKNLMWKLPSEKKTLAIICIKEIITKKLFDNGRIAGVNWQIEQHCDHS